MGNRYVEGLCVGGALGFLAGMLSAPKSGSELRKDLKQGSEELYKQAIDSVGDLREIRDLALQDVRQTQQELSQSVDQLKSTMSDKLHDIKDKGMAMKTMISDRVSHLQEVKEEVSEKVAGLTEKGRALRDEMTDKVSDLTEKGRALKEQVAARADEVKEKISTKMGDANLAPGEAAEKARKIKDLAAEKANEFAQESKEILSEDMSPGLDGSKSLEKNPYKSDFSQGSTYPTV